MSAAAPPPPSAATRVSVAKARFIRPPCRGSSGANLRQCRDRDERSPARAAVPRTAPPPCPEADHRAWRDHPQRSMICGRTRWTNGGRSSGHRRPLVRPVVLGVGPGVFTGPSAHDGAERWPPPGECGHRPRQAREPRQLGALPPTTVGTRLTMGGTRAVQATPLNAHDVSGRRGRLRGRIPARRTEGADDGTAGAVNALKERHPRISHEGFPAALMPLGLSHRTRIRGAEGC